MCILYIYYIKGCIYFLYYFHQYRSFNYKDFIVNNNKINNFQDNMGNYNEITKLKNELSKANKRIEQQNLIINDLRNKLNNYNIEFNNLNNDINKNKQKLNKNINSKIQNNANLNDIVNVNFISTGQNIQFSVDCAKNTIFAEVEEKLYKQYPQYRETNNSFIANGTQVLRFKTIAENNIVNDLPITLIEPE